MYFLLITLHVIVSFIMIGVILLQAGKGAEIGASFGGSSQTIFGSRGPGTFLSKLTVAAAVIFMLTSLSLSVLSKGRFISTSVLDLKTKEAPPAEAPATPPSAAGGGSAAPATTPENPAPTPAPAAPGPESQPKSSP
ncbi:MAG: preprotein translocase subunit SecG [Nitrospirae bacterium]|nr:preprotein translocase subunit SecG [Nitrospirota bacterium]